MRETSTNKLIMHVSIEHKKQLKRALRDLEERYDTSKFDNWKWKNDYQRLELYDWEFASEHKEEIAKWLEGHEYKCTCRFGMANTGYGTIYLDKPLTTQLRTLFSLTWS